MLTVLTTTKTTIATTEFAIAVETTTIAIATKFVCIISLALICSNFNCNCEIAETSPKIGTVSDYGQQNTLLILSKEGEREREIFADYSLTLLQSKVITRNFLTSCSQNSYFELWTLK